MRNIIPNPRLTSEKRPSSSFRFSAAAFGSPNPPLPVGPRVVPGNTEDDDEVGIPFVGVPEFGIPVLGVPVVGVPVVGVPVVGKPLVGVPVVGVPVVGVPVVGVPVVGVPVVGVPVVGVPLELQTTVTKINDH